MSFRIQVVVQTPAHSRVAGALTYGASALLQPGTLVRVPLGRREVLGIVWEADQAAEQHEAAAALAPSEAELRVVTMVLDGVAPLSRRWRELVTFAARYYQRGMGEVALAALPPPLRGLDAVQLARRLKSPKASAVPVAATAEASAGLNEPRSTPQSIATSAEQQTAIDRIHAENGPFLLFGTTGSGKTEVYLQAVERLLLDDPTAQALVMVPEINLTPQLEARFRERFAPAGSDARQVVSLHSGMTNPQRLKSWLAAHSGAARIVLGTRMAIFASMPQLKLIVVDEEHDPSYKQQEGARYSARDLALWRGQNESAKVVLGSATPSFESWHHSRPVGTEGESDPGGRITRLAMPSRITGPDGAGGALPQVRMVNMTHQPPRTVFSAPLMAAIGERIARGEQAMVFLNRRGYAPVLTCHDCGWKSECPHCSAFRVFHKIDRSLRCHHCGFAERVPRACPACGNPDIAPLGRGTERLEEHLSELLHGVRRPDGSHVRVARIDADTTRAKGALESQLAEVHAGDVDVLVGTQMIAKGHDFRRITLVAAINADGALFSSDFRAAERLFSLLMQAAGRAGRDARHAGASEMWVQTEQPQHPLFQALKAHDYPAFAAQQLAERKAADMPPFAFQALVRSEARTQDAAQAFLIAGREAATAAGLDDGGLVTAFGAVPMTIQRVANIERAQMLLESSSRPALQRFLAAWQPLLRETRSLPEHKGVVRWAVDVDPLAV
jgi:primosomal protein N' (replication factor Y)